jgi:hypothetical protein
MENYAETHRACRYLLLSTILSFRPAKNSPSHRDGPLKRRCYSGQPARTHFGALTIIMLTGQSIFVEVGLTPIRQT